MCDVRCAMCDQSMRRGPAHPHTRTPAHPLRTRFAPASHPSCLAAHCFRCCHAAAAAAAYAAAAARSHVIDYIFHTSQLKCTDVLGPPAAADLEPTRLPGMRAPSDHLPIAAKFAIVPGGRVPPVLLTHAI